MNRREVRQVEERMNRLVAANQRRRRRERERARANRTNANILDAPIPEINVPILKPDAPVRSKSKSLNKVSKPVRKEINNFAEWVDSFVVLPKKTVNERVERLKKRVNEIFERYERYNPRERQTALEGTLKTHGIEG